MDIQKVFGQSIDTIWRRKTLILPYFVSIAIVLLLGTLFLFATGIHAFVYDLVTLTNAFEEEYYSTHPSQPLITLLTRNDPAYATAYDTYLAEHNFSWYSFIALFTAKNAILLLFFLLVIMLASFYLSAFSCVFTTAAVNKKTATYKQLILATNNYFWRYAWLTFFRHLILFAPALVVFLIVFACFLINTLLGVLSLLLILVYLVYLVFVGLRLYFSEPILFFDNTRSVEALKKSYSSTKRILLFVAMIAILTFLFSGIIGNLLYKSFVELYGHALFSPLTYSNIFLTSFALCLALVYSIVPAFTRVLVFTSYNHVKRWR